MQRRAYRITAGDIRNLKISEEDLPDPSVGQVQIAVHAIGLNFADLYTVWGMYKAAPAENFIPGLEYAGEIVKTGEGVERWSTGDMVMGITRFGAYVDTLNIDEKYVVDIPEGWSIHESAGFLVQALTAYYGLVELGRLQRGENVLIHSGAGGVGIQANRIAQKLGAYTIGTVSSEHKTDLLRREGYNNWIVRGDSFRDDLMTALDGRPLNLIMECIGGKILMDGFKTLAPEGRMIVYGNASFTTHSDRPNKLRMLWRYLRRPKIDPLQLPNSNKSIMGFNLIWLYNQVDRFNRIVSELRELNMPPPVLGGTFSFEDLPEAMRRLQSGKTKGKIVVET